MDKKHRIFIAINLPDDVKKKIVDFQKKWADSRLAGQAAARWVKPENIHITLVFIGYVIDKQLEEIRRLVRQIAENCSPFNIKLERICFGSPQGPPRMIWLEGERSKEFADLKNNLENALLDSAASGYNHLETRDFHPHITLARFKQLQRINLPKINVEFNESMFVNSIEIMESKLKRDGAEYVLFESINLGQ